MTSKSGSVTGEPERKRQKRIPSSPSQSSSGPGGVSPISRELSSVLRKSSSTQRKVSSSLRAVFSTSIAVSAPSSSSAAPSPNVVTRRASDQTEVKMTSTPTDPHNLRGVRSKAGLEMLQGDHFTIKVRCGLVEPQTKWVLPRKLLTSRSPYFACTFKTQHTLPFFEEAAFELFTQWLYLGELEFDGDSVPSETLVTAWTLGNEFECPAFRDHVMVQLTKSHYERGIKPQTLYDSLEHVYSGPKLRKWAIDQFRAKITYGYTGYDDQKEDNPSDGGTWKRYAKDVKAFAQNFLEAYLDAGQVVNRAKKPWENGQQYMEVLNYAEIGACKRECRSMKAEAALTKAEGR